MMTQQPPLVVHTDLITNEPHLVTQHNIDRSDGSKAVVVLEGAIRNEASGQARYERPVNGEAEMQACFENATKKALNIPSGYRKVAVLIIRWHKDIDDESNREKHSKEIARLKQVFEARLNFVCSEVDLHTNEKPQHILKEAIATHIRRNDDPNNLLIIYYTGHGTMVGEEPNERLEMSATRNPQAVRGVHPATAEWNDAEMQLLSDSMDADVLTILDCCYAGGAHKGSPRHKRTYELLAACSRDRKTPGPGPHSFTSRLLNAIEELLDAPESGPMVTTRLIAMVNKEKRRNGTHAEQHDRLSKHDGHIQLAPVEKFTEQEDKTTKSKPTPEGAVVKLRISLEHGKLNTEQVKLWGEEIFKAGQTADVPVLRIDWLKVNSLRKAVLYVQDSMKRKSITADLEGNDDLPLQKKRTLDSLEPGNQTDASPMTPVSDACQGL